VQLQTSLLQPVRRDEYVVIRIIDEQDTDSRHASPVFYEIPLVK
jgi:hypothetical protein